MDIDSIITTIVLNCNYILLFLVDETFVNRQKQVLSLFAYFKQVATEAEWYKIGHDYDVEANINNYTVSSFKAFYFAWWNCLTCSWRN